MPKEDIAILEARKLNIPVIAITDTNANPDQADYMIVANDDSIKTIDLITGVIAAAVQKGSSEYKAKAESESPAEEEVV